MKCKMMASAFVLGFGLIVSAATACPGGCGKKAKDSGTKLIKANDTAPSAAKTVASKPCCAKKATTVAAKNDCNMPCCAKKAAKASAKATAKGGCNKPCGAKSATTVADKPGCGENCDKPCCAKKRAAKASAKAKGGCSKPCGKSATTASGKSPCSGKGATTASADGGCPIARKVNAVLASMPAMKYRVGDETTGCSKSAAAMAEKSGKTMQYVIGDDVVEGEGEAITKLTELLENYAAKLATVQYVANGKCGSCPMTAKSIAKKTGTTVAYRVGGIDFATKENANKALEAVTAALESVKMEYKVDGKKFGCSKMAGAKCKDSGKKMTYVVGDQETGCSVSAKRILAESKVRTIVETAVQSSFSL